MTSSKTLFYLCLWFIFGIAVSSFLKIPQIILWGILALGVVVICITIYSKNRRPHLFGVNKGILLLISFCLLFLVIGVLRLQISEFNRFSDTISKLNDKPEKITLVGQVVSEPDIRDASQKLKVLIRDTRSTILVTVAPHSPYHYLDTLELVGKLKNPMVFDDFNYQDYLAKDGIYSVMDFPAITVINQKIHYSPWSFFYQRVLGLKQILLQSLDKAFGPGQRDIMQGIVFGNDKNMSKELKAQFNATGLSHITAVSGSNIVILISILLIFLLALGFWRSQALYGALALVWLYIILIGFPISGVRAAIMGSVALLAQTFGRQNTSSRVIVVTAALLLLQNPMLLFYDISFQLSFLASLAIIHIKPILDRIPKYLARFRKKTNQDKATMHSSNKFFWDIIFTTIAAQLLALPIIVYNFGTISLVSLLTNLLILPIIPLLTVMGFIVSIVGAIWSPLGFIAALPSVFLMGYVLKILDIFSQPWAMITLKNVSWVWLAMYYLVLTGVIWHINKSRQPEFLDF